MLFRMHYRRGDRLQRKRHPEKEKTDKGPAGVRRLLCLNPWRTFLDLEQEKQDVLCQKCKFQEKQSGDCSVWQQRMWQREALNVL